MRSAGVKNPFLIGHKVYLRPLESEDAPLLVSWLNDAEIIRNLLQYRPVNLKVEVAFLDKLYQNDDVVLGIAARQTDELLGAAGLHPIDFKNRHARFGLFLGVKSEWGKGYGTEATALLVRHAFETLNLNRVWLHVFEDNLRGIRAYEKVGFRREGVLRQSHYREDHYWDSLAMAILREEWQGGRSAKDSGPLAGDSRE
jgi:RimJ/RimL family protein N-acetyltransferase